VGIRIQIRGDGSVTLIKGNVQRNGLGGKGCKSIFLFLKVEAQRFFADFTHPLFCGRPFNFQLHLVGPLGIDNIIAMSDINIHSAIFNTDTDTDTDKNMDKDKDEDEDTGTTRNTDIDTGLEFEFEFFCNIFIWRYNPYSALWNT
jgi:hypothetical protein